MVFAPGDRQGLFARLKAGLAKTHDGFINKVERLILRRNSGIVWYRAWWFKFQLYIAVIVFFMTYFHTEYFFQVLGMRYRFDAVTLYFDSQLLGPPQATAP